MSPIRRYAGQASLDPAATKALEEIIQAIHEGGTKIIMTTHDLGQARRLADEVLFLHRGRLLEHSRASARSGIESVAIRAWMGDSSMRLMAGPDSTGWVTTA